jgi:chromosomal replication initiator protein
MKQTTTNKTVTTITNMKAMGKDCKTVWNNCLEIIRANVGEQSFKTWFEPISPARLAQNTLTIQVPSQFFYEWLEEHYVHVLKKAIINELGSAGKLEYSIVVDKGSNKQKPLSINLPNAATMRPQNTQTYTQSVGNTVAIIEREKAQANYLPEAKVIPHPHIRSNLNKQYNFDNFIEGDCNRLAYAAAQAVAKNPGLTSFNPLVIYGGVGLGKTHLVQAIGNEIKQNLPQKQVLYVSSDQFITQFVDAVKSNQVQFFTTYYLQVDVLIIDDIQFFAGKEKTQESFFHIFNHLHQAGKQIIMTSDCPPKNLQGLEERLLSRFKWGLTTDVKVPDEATRLEIVKSKAKQEGLEIPKNVMEFVAKNVDTNIRELQGVLVSLMAKSSLTRKTIDLQMAKETIEDIVKHQPMDLNVEYIQKAVAEYMGIKVEELKAATRKQEIAHARQIAMFFCQTYTKSSVKMIGEMFGGRDHSTVTHASKAVEKKAKADEAYKAVLEGIKAKMKLS